MRVRHCPEAMATGIPPSMPLTVGECESIPGTVGLLFVSGQSDRRRELGLESLIFQELPKPSLFEVIRPSGKFGDVALAHVGHLDERNAKGFCVGAAALCQTDCR